MTDHNEVYDFKRYKDFLTSKVGPSRSRKGVKSAIAKTLRCQPTYVSQILNGSAHLSLEQAEKLGDFFAMTAEEKHFFLLLVQKDRAGTYPLKQYFDHQIEQILNNRLVLTKRFGSHNTLSKEDQSIYYSSWQYAAVHMALTIPAFQNPVHLAKSLGSSRSRISEVLKFLERIGLIKEENGSYRVTESEIRIGTDSHNIIKLHTHWRNRAIDSLDHEAITDLHYSAVVTLSREDIVRLKEQMLEFIASTVKEIRKSKEEELYCFAVDFFNVIHSS